MLRLFANSLLKAAPQHPHNFQTVRWLPRKPIWMPTAKSKLFRIPQRQRLPPEEEEELKRLFNNYRTAVKSIRKFLTDRYNIRLQAKADTELERKIFEEDLARCRAINDQWNEKISLEREERISKQLEEEIQFAEQRKKLILEEREQLMSEVEEIVRREKEAVGSFITMENLDNAIAKAIDNPVDYNFAIDLEGNRIIGRETKPDNAKVSSAIKQ